MNYFSRRLRSERERLGLSQTDFGAIAGVKRNAQMNYENGTRAPDADYLSAIAEAGVDIHYVVTGKRVLTESDVQTELKNLADAWEAIEIALREANKTLPVDKMRQAAEALYQAVKNGEGQAEPLARLLTKAA